MSKGLGILQKRILIMLAGGLALASASSRPDYITKIWREIEKEWKKVSKNAIQKSIQSLYKSKLIDIEENKDGFTSIIILDKGQKKILCFKLDEITINKSKKWDKKWRIVIFDIPETSKSVRDIVRQHLKRIGFYELQKSVFIFPHECQNEIEFLIEAYNVRPHIRQIIANQIDNELHLKHIFNL